MKTITEFQVTTLKNAAKTKQEVVAEGKTPEELTAALGEALKLEGDKLTFILNALELVQSKDRDLKRVVVFTLAEPEVAPKGAIQKGEHYYSVDYFPPLPGQERSRAPQDRDGGKRDGKRGDRKGKGGPRGAAREGGGRDSGRPPGSPPRDARAPHAPRAAHERPAPTPGRIDPDFKIIVKPVDPNAPAPAPKEKRAPRPPREKKPRAPRPPAVETPGVSAAPTGPAEIDAEGKPVFKIVITGKKSESQPVETAQPVESQTSAPQENSASEVST
jgi:hypothetical protein